MTDPAQPPQPAARDAAPETIRAWQAIGLASLGTTAGVLPIFLLGALSVQISETLALRPVHIGLLFAAFSTVSAAGSAPAGRLVERIGATWALRCSTLTSAVTLVGIGAVARSWAGLLLFVLIGGFGNSLTQPGANLALARRIPPRRQGVAFGIKQSAVPTATLLAGLAVPIAGLWLGWQWAFVGAAALTPLLFLSYGRLSDQSARPSADRQRVRLYWQRLLLLAAAAGLATAAATAMGAFLVPAGVAIGFAPGPAGLVLATASLVVISGRVVLGWVVDRGAVSPWRLIARIMAGGVAGLVLLTFATHPLWFLAGAVAALAGAWSWSGLMNYAVVQENPGAPAASTSITQGGLYLGAALGPLAFGFAVDVASYRVAWLGATASVAVALGLVLLAQRLGRDRQPGYPT